MKDVAQIFIVSGYVLAHWIMEFFHIAQVMNYFGFESGWLDQSRTIFLYEIPAWLIIAPFIDRPIDNTLGFKIFFYVCIFIIVPAFWTAVGFGIIKLVKFLRRKFRKK